MLANWPVDQEFPVLVSTEQTAWDTDRILDLTLK